jgi:hypothetical protein
MEKMFASQQAVFATDGAGWQIKDIANNRSPLITQ